MVAQRSGTNWFAIGISIAVVVVLIALGGLVVWLNGQNSAGGAPEGPAIDTETGAIQVGEGPDEVAIWFDFYCPHCQDFEAIYGPEVRTLVEDGAISLQLHPVALSGLNAASGTNFSERSASALYCVAEVDPEAVLTFTENLFAQRPTGAGLTDEQLATLASDAGAPAAADCIADGTYGDFATAQAGELPTDPDSGGAGTPTLVVNGEVIAITGSVQADIVNRLNG